MTTEVVEQGTTKNSVTIRLADRWGVQPAKMMSALMGAALSSVSGKISQPQLMAFLMVADAHRLNPFTREIFAFPDKQGGIVPVVSVDGWSRIVNENPHFNGVEFRYSETSTTMTGAKPCPDWCEAVIYRKDREHPIVVREYLDEVYRPPIIKEYDNKSKVIDGPWQSHTKRMLRHKALIQGARVAFGFAGIYDEDEAYRIVEQRAKVVDVQAQSYASRTEQVAAAVGAMPEVAPAQAEPPPLSDNSVDVEDEFNASIARELIEEGKLDDAKAVVSRITNATLRSALEVEITGE